MDLTDVVWSGLGSGRFFDGNSINLLISYRILRSIWCLYKDGENSRIGVGEKGACDSLR